MQADVLSRGTLKICRIVALRSDPFRSFQVPSHLIFRPLVSKSQRNPEVLSARLLAAAALSRSTSELVHVVLACPTGTTGWQIKAQRLALGRAPHWHLMRHSCNIWFGENRLPADMSVLTYSVQTQTNSLCSTEKWSRRGTWGSTRACKGRTHRSRKLQHGPWSWEEKHLCSFPHP